MLNEKEYFTTIVKRINPTTKEEFETECDFNCIYYDCNTKAINGVKEMELCVALNDYGDMTSLTPIRNIVRILD